MAGGMTCSKGRIVVILGAMEGEEEDTSREEEEVEEEVRGWTLHVKALFFPALCPEFCFLQYEMERPGTVVTYHMV